MYSSTEIADMNSILSACLSHIQQKRSEFKRTKSQVPATSELWFIEVDLKKIHSIPDFLVWVQDKFAPQFVQHRFNTNKHIARVFNNIATEIINQVQRYNNIGPENQAAISALLVLESTPTPPLTPPIDYDNLDKQANWSDSIASMSKL